MAMKVRARLRTAFARMLVVAEKVGAPALIETASKLTQDFMTEEQQDHFDEGKFGPVLKLLSDLIAKLEEEMNAETSQHEWCETEKSQSAAAKGEREKLLKHLRTEIEQK